MNMHMYLYLHVYMYGYTHACIYMCICMCMHVCAYVLSHNSATSESQRYITCDSLGDVTWSHGIHDVRDLSGRSDSICIYVCLYMYAYTFTYARMWVYICTRVGAFCLFVLSNLSTTCACITGVS